MKVLLQIKKPVRYFLILKSQMASSGGTHPEKVLVRGKKSTFMATRHKSNASDTKVSKIGQSGNTLLINGKDAGVFETTRKGKTIEIDRLYINKELQKSGIGKRIIPHLFQSNPDVEQVEVYPSGKSEPFWISQGVDHYTDDDAIIYTRESILTHK